MEYRKRTITEKQLNKLMGLAYWIADLHYIREKYGADDPETETCRKTIDLIFTELDALETPFSVQNMVIVWAENWRAYMATTTKAFLETRNVKIA